jgi:hypothetical protein
LEKRLSRFDRLRQEKEKYPTLYGKSTVPKTQGPEKKAKPKELSDKASEAIANALRLMMNEKQP